MFDDCRCVLLVVSHVSGWRVLFVCCLLVVVLMVGVCWSVFVGCCSLCIPFVGWLLLYVVCCSLFVVWRACYVGRCVLRVVCVCAMSCGGCRYLLSVAHWLVLVVCGVIIVACVVYVCCVLCCVL